ncbi:hypothetical protein WKW50_20900, partial [Ochrobactrum sp. GPK 3]
QTDRCPHLVHQFMSLRPRRFTAGQAYSWRDFLNGKLTTLWISPQLSAQMHPENNALQIAANLILSNSWK